ncbi:hypothetical protein B0T14DRAFT_133448 [Immersiella caudata]|uniref:Uncharacterized protein n=1 Tax=Immersiella caudata TaxID=314043 RepID=A0AA39X4R9_9PEZI|nr:hypothetical protein B0T14DRAFT_133448 [Immersiella caudata]
MLPTDGSADGPDLTPFMSVCQYCSCLSCSHRIAGVGPPHPPTIPSAPRKDCAPPSSPRRECAVGADRYCGARAGGEDKDSTPATGRAGGETIGRTGVAWLISRVAPFWTWEGRIVC